MTHCMAYTVHAYVAAPSVALPRLVDIWHLTTLLITTAPSVSFGCTLDKFAPNGGHGEARWCQSNSV